MKPSSTNDLARPAPSRGKCVPVIILVALVTIVAIGVAVVLRSHAQRNAILARIPAHPALTANTSALEPALARAEASLRDGPLADGIGRLGKLYQANYFFDESAACYALAMELDGRNAQWPYLLAYVLNMKGQTETTTALLDTAIALAPDYVPALLRRADNRYKIGDRDVAAEDYTHVLDLESRNEYAHLGLARIAADAEQWESAEKHLQAALAADPTFGVAYRLIGEVYGRMGRADDEQRALHAADAYSRFVATPDPWVDELDRWCVHTEKLLTKGYMAEKLGHPDQAADYYRRILQIEPNNFDANFRLGVLRQTLGNPDEAEPLLKKALTLETGDDTRYKVIHTNLGNLYFQADKTDDAVVEYSAALAQDPEFEAAHTGIAAALLKQGRMDDAIEHCQRALAINPELDSAYYNWGLALLGLGDIDQATRLNPKLPSADYQLGIHYSRLGQRELAIEHLTKALEAATAAGDTRLATAIRQVLAQQGR